MKVLINVIIFRRHLFNFAIIKRLFFNWKLSFPSANWVCLSRWKTFTFSKMTFPPPFLLPPSLTLFSFLPPFPQTSLSLSLPLSRFSNENNYLKFNSSIVLAPNFLFVWLEIWSTLERKKEFHNRCQNFAKFQQIQVRVF